VFQICTFVPLQNTKYFMNSNYYVAIMAGGIGSRFWPLSRTNKPKQFLDILGTGKTLIQQTVDRYLSFIPKENIYIVTSADYVELTQQELPDIAAQNILAEPSRKNTAACIAYISYKLKQINSDALLICAPADHLIIDIAAFAKTCTQALGFVAKNNALVTIGIKPTRPNTGYGYIQYEQNEDSKKIYKVKTFTEKPDLELAKTFLKSGDFLWNAGIFVWHTNTIVEAFEQHLPEMHELFEAAKDSFNTPNESASINQIYPLCTNISIDYGIMERPWNMGQHL
jgi:mannose-1-phosphate guanylyltransferase